jgi:hypothetical protein
MELDLKELQESCDFCCNLHRKILNDEAITVDKNFINHFETNLRVLITFVLKRIRWILEIQWESWDLAVKAIKKIHTKYQNTRNSNLDPDMKKSCQIYFELLYQIQMDCIHLSEGEIQNDGQMEQVQLYFSLMDRSRNIEGCKNFGIKDLIKPNGKQYSCVSLDGLKSLCIHLFYFKKEKNIKFKVTYTMNWVETQIDACYQSILAAKDKLKLEFNDDTFDKKFGGNIIFTLRPSQISAKMGFKKCYNVMVLGLQVFIQNIDILFINFNIIL